MIPNNVCTVRLTAAAGTNLARTSSEIRSNTEVLSASLTAVYNPKAFIPHAASLGQTCVHCRRFSTAATRRCLGSVSVPVSRAMLSHPVPIEALVGHYPANKLIGRGPVPRRRSFGPETIIRYYRQFPAAIPNPGVGIHALLSLSPLSISCKQETSRATCMPNPRRQRSF